MDCMKYNVFTYHVLDVAIVLHHATYSSSKDSIVESKLNTNKVDKIYSANH